MKLVDSKVCGFCNEDLEDIIHVFVDCPCVKNLWSRVEFMLTQYVHKGISLKRETVLFGFPKSFTLLNHIILITKKYIHLQNIKGNQINFDQFLIFVKDVIKIEKFIANKAQNLNSFFLKWTPLLHLLD